jgi:glycosyltransferase involved in cell wall biosynthesis
MSGLHSVQGPVLLVGNDVEYFTMHRLALARALARRGIDLHVALPSAPQEPTLLQQPFKLHTYELRRASTNPAREATAFWQLRRLYDSLCPALIHHFTIKPVLYGSFASRGLPSRVVNSVTGLGYLFTNESGFVRVLRTIVLPILRAGCKRSSVTMAFENRDDLSVYLRNNVCTEEQCTVLPSAGIDVANFSHKRTPHAGTVVMLLSRMLYAKGVLEFIDAARIARRNEPTLRFVLVGGSDPNPESIPLDKLRAAHAEGAIEYWGPTGDPGAALAQADVLCLPSYREGLPRSLLEGALMGLPLIASDVPGCRDVVEHERNGLLVPVKSSAPIAEAALRLHRSPELRVAMGEEGRKFVSSRYTVEAVADQTIAVYLAALGAPRVLQIRD